MRKNKNKRIKAVLPDCTADTEGVINFVNKVIRTKTKTYTTAQYCGRIAGVIAGTPMTIACTYAPLPEVIGCDVWTKEEMDTMTDAGKLFFFFDGEKVKLGRGINSLVTTVQGKGASFQKIKLVDLMDMMYDDIRTTAQDHYLGKYANRCLLVTAIQRNLDQHGKYTKEQLADMSEMDIKMANIGSNVFIAVDASFLDVMEDVTIAVNI